MQSCPAFFQLLLALLELLLGQDGVGEVIQQSVILASIGSGTCIELMKPSV